MKKNQILLIVTVLLLNSVLSLCALTIHSTEAGGYWGNTSTWVGDYIPSGVDDVILHGPVNSADNSCNNLTIEASGGLTNHTYISRTHYVNGNLSDGQCRKLRDLG